MPIAAQHSPQVSGYERFHETAPLPDRAGGALLLGELNCTACHASERRDIVPKAAPRLDRLARGLNPTWLRRFISNPQSAKPGTTMPDVLPMRGRGESVEDLVHYVASLSKPFERIAPDKVAAARGKELFHSVGCVACHVPESAAALTRLDRRWSHEGLRQFLSRPLHVRPSGRMPDLGLSAREASDIAHYLLRGKHVVGRLGYTLYYGRFRRLKSLETAKPERAGLASDIDLGVAGRKHRYALVFEAHLSVPRTGRYTFYLRADERARLSIDGRSLLHVPRPQPKFQSVTVDLDSRWHELRIDFVQQGRGAFLDVEWEGPGLARSPLSKATLKSSLKPVLPSNEFVLDKERVRRGEKLFATQGCNACHNVQAWSTAPAAALATLDKSAGCLDEGERKGVRYALSSQQRDAIRAALTAKPPAKPSLVAELTRHNCYACHERDGRGGLVDAAMVHFSGEDGEEDAEMSFPPTLTKVGDKLKEPWLRRAIQDGARVRPEMQARMPRFGNDNVRGLSEALIAADRRPVPSPKVTDSVTALKEAGRKLVGNSGLGCVRCHVFHRHEAPTIQAPDLILSTERVHRDWFERFVLNPESLKAGTRMPTFWSDGRSTVKDVLDGDPQRQIAAMWTYLADGRKAVHPEGLTRKQLELIVGGTTRLYRGKIWEAGFRGICVGYADEINLAFDAEELRLALLWKGRFLNVAAHWRVQGMGRIRPHGHSVLKFAHGPAFAVLASRDAAWPDVEGRRKGDRFKGYDLDKKRDPTLRYSIAGVDIEDEPRVRLEDKQARLRRTLRFAGKMPEGMHFRAATGDKIATREGAFVVDGDLTLRIRGGQARVRKSGSEDELLVAIAKDSRELIIEYAWRSQR